MFARSRAAILSAVAGVYRDASGSVAVEAACLLPLLIVIAAGGLNIGAQTQLRQGVQLGNSVGCLAAFRTYTSQIMAGASDSAAASAAQAAAQDAFNATKPTLFAFPAESSFSITVGSFGATTCETVATQGRPLPFPPMTEPVTVSIVQRN